ncbi:MAG: permease-like cell division protein FtsX [Bacilli bacterium]|nr:permease-like cell division protein FtsX [Bacilli bacterium]MBP3635537.1 permease-like cell division protein FtsX [Bacilli bacterium]
MIKMKNIRILLKNIRDGLKNIVRNFSLSLASISCITVTLLIVAVSMIGSYNVENFTKVIRDDFTIVVYMNNDLDEDKESKIKDEIEKLSNIESIEYNSKKEIAENMKKESEIFNTIISSWSESENPLYDTYLVKVKDSEKISNAAKRIKKIDGVVMVKYGEGMIESLLSIFNIIEKILIITVLSLIIVTAFLIINTIKITIFSRQEEIEIKRLVGASNFSIKQPFVIEGLFIGLIGSIIPVISTIYGYSTLYEKTGGVLFSKFITLVKPFPFVFIVSFVLIVIGIVVGMIGSSRAVRKYLKI